MIRRPPRSTLTDTLLPYTTLFRSQDSSRFMSIFAGGLSSGRGRKSFKPQQRGPYEGSTQPGRHRPKVARSEEHTSELQSLMRISYAVFCLKKKKNNEQH